MTIHRTVKKVGGSLAVLIPRDVADMMSVTEDSPIRLSVVGRNLVVEPEDDVIPEASFRRAFATVLRRYGPAFEQMAKYDDGRIQRPRRKSLGP
jgi:antitoxin component of MazEF toxin-antitoxin module